MEKNHILFVNGTVQQVSVEVYKAYYSFLEKERYQKRRDKKYGLISYSEWDFNKMSGADCISSDENVENEVIRLLVFATLRKCLDSLSEIDRQIIVRIFWNLESEKEVGQALGVSQQSIHSRKKRILKKLRQSLEKFDF